MILRAETLEEGPWATGILRGSALLSLPLAQAKWSDREGHDMSRSRAVDLWAVVLLAA